MVAIYVDEISERRAVMSRYVVYIFLDPERHVNEDLISIVYKNPCLESMIA